MSPGGEDAQRDLEQRALRNVRGLLDRMEGEEETRRRGVVRVAIISVVVAIVATALVVGWMSARRAAPAAGAVIIPAAPANTAK